MADRDAWTPVPPVPCRRRRETGQADLTLLDRRDRGKYLKRIPCCEVGSPYSTASATTRADSLVAPESSRLPTLFSRARSFHAARRPLMRAGGPTSEHWSISASGTAAAASCFLPPRNRS